MIVATALMTRAITTVLLMPSDDVCSSARSPMLSVTGVLLVIVVVAGVVVVDVSVSRGNRKKVALC